MKHSILFSAFILSAITFASCNSSSSPSAASKASGGTRSPDSALTAEWAGTYGGAQGTVMTLAIDGKAYIGYLSSDENIDMDSSWSYTTDTLHVICKSFGYEIFADTEVRDDDILLFMSEDPSWNPEPFVKISSAATVFSKDHYLAMMEDIDFNIEGLPTHDRTKWNPSSSYETVVIGGLEFRIPGYYKATESGDHSITYGVKDENNALTLITIRVIGNALSGEDFRKVKYGFPDLFMKNMGAKNHRIMDAKNCIIAGQQARLFTFYTETENYGQNHIRVACINNVKSGHCISVSIMQSLDSLHDFINDYDKIIEAAVLVADSKNTDQEHQEWNQQPVSLENDIDFGLIDRTQEYSHSKYKQRYLVDTDRQIMVFYDYSVGKWNIKIKNVKTYRYTVDGDKLILIDSGGSSEMHYFKKITSDAYTYYSGDRKLNTYKAVDPADPVETLTKNWDDPDSLKKKRLTPE